MCTAAVLYYTKPIKQSLLAKGIIIIININIIRAIVCALLSKSIVIPRSPSSTSPLIRPLWLSMSLFGCGLLAKLESICRICLLWAREKWKQSKQTFLTGHFRSFLKLTIIQFEHKLDWIDQVWPPPTLNTSSLAPYLTLWSGPPPHSGPSACLDEPNSDFCDCSTRLNWLLYLSILITTTPPE